MIPKILCPLSYVDANYLAPVLTALGPDVAMMVKPHHIGAHGLLLQTLSSAGVTLTVHDDALFKEYPYVLLEHGYLADSAPSGPYDACRTIAYTHATDTGVPSLRRCNHFIAHSEAVLRHGTPLRLICENGVAHFGVTDDGFSEAASTGLFHLGQWETRRKEPQSMLKEEVLTLLGKVNPEQKKRPLIVYYEDEFNDPASVCRGLQRLARRCTLVIKPITDALRPCCGPSIFYVEQKTFSSFLLRFAADVIMGGGLSGVGTTSVMLGRPYISVCTEELFDRMNSGASLGNFFNFYEKFSPNHTHRRMCRRIAPLHIEDTETLLRHIHDLAWWQRYHEQIPQWQKEIFGHYRLEGAAEYTATLLRSILVRGTMIPSSLHAQIQG